MHYSVNKYTSYIELNLCAIYSYTTDKTKYNAKIAVACFTYANVKGNITILPLDLDKDNVLDFLTLR